MAFHPYLNFGGNCREAFTRYQQIFGGELFIMPMSEIPPGDAPPDTNGELIAHAALMFEDHLLMASDASPDDSPGVRGMYVNFTTKDVSTAEKVFADLSEGGAVEMPMERTFWSPAFGVCTDRFGTPWMVSAEDPANPSSS